MQRFPRYCLLCTAALAMTVMAVSLGQRLGNRAAAQPSLDDWDIPTLTDHLQRAGLDVQLCSLRGDGSFDRNAYLTTTHKDWEELNRLCINPGPNRIQEWRGIVYFELASKGEPGFLHWEDHVLVVGRFLFCGDAELLERIRAVLMPFAPPVAP
ncbi:MAG TPA: hypothetical protein VMF69_00390 [Gemmataceae bacterium]|nr:hypothetical protein [Gemmataceae bacterium]